MKNEKLENVTAEEQEINLDEISAEELEAQAGGLMPSMIDDCNGTFTCVTYD
ncbi:hypothetical protein [Pseudoalteromonas sp. NBT06-2]|uniref:hypothetical protein n=1 Tax=Pseudoalteromonas sp. NBT06-2 TaxID=2025950 RepID=UPI0014831233|nr:hypothetical protein [Pseudoalteromonas sp. NBT06-2]